MKIFSFNLNTNQRGELLANIAAPTSVKGMCKPEGGARKPVARIYQPSEYESRFDKCEAYNPATYGVEAICFCIGQFDTPGAWNDAERAANGWSWRIITAKDWQPDPAKQTWPTKVGAASNGEGI